MQGRPYVAVPSLLLCGLALCEMFLATRRYWFAAGALTAHATAMRWACWVSVAALVLLALSGRARRAVADHLEHFGRQSPGCRAAWLGVAYLGIFTLLLFLKYCQHRACILTLDSAATTNILYNFLHHGTLECTVYGIVNELRGHFIPGLVLWAPLLLLHHSLMPLLIVQTALVASLPIAAYLLARRRAGSSLAGWAALWLVFTSPFFFELASAGIVFQMCFPAFLLWGLCFAEAGFWMPAALCGLLLVGTTEQAPVLGFGLGLWLAATASRRGGRGRWAGAAVCAGSVLLWCLEIWFIRSSAEGRTMNASYWGGYFGNMAQSPAALIWRVVTEPFSVLRQVAWPPANLGPMAKLLLSTGLLCLLAPAELAVWAVVTMPHLISNPGVFYHDLRLQYSAYVTGPLWWAMAMGAAWLYRNSGGRGTKSLLPLAALGFGALNFWSGPAVLVPGWPEMFVDEIPAAAARIPPEASVWAYDPAAPWVGCRAFLKIIPNNLEAPSFAARSFVPDYVLLNRYMVSHDMVARSRERLLTFLAREGYAKVSESIAIVLLKHPRAPLATAGGRPPPLELPEPGPDAAAYWKYLDAFTDATGEIALLLPAAEGGEAVAQHYLAVVYSGAFGGAPDMAEAVKWFRRSAEQGNAADEYNLGIFLAQGVGTARDEAEARRWLARAAAHGAPAAGAALERLARH